MKAKQIIEVRNYRGFDENNVLKEGHSSSFRVHPDEVLEEKLKEHGLTEQEQKDVCTRILKGNPHWVTIENKEDEKKLEKAIEEKKKREKRKEELFKLNKKEQVALLKVLKANNFPLSEADRIELILNLEKL